jgi:hypothetical protein
MFSKLFYYPPSFTHSISFTGSPDLPLERMPATLLGQNCSSKTVQYAL